MTGSSMVVRLLSTCISIFILLQGATLPATAETATHTREVLGLGADPGLTKEICDHVERLPICAEKATALELAMEESSLMSFRALWDANILCHDMTFVSTKDNQLVAGSADSFRWIIEELDSTEIPWPSTHYTVRQIREKGATFFQLPTLDQFVRDVRRRLSEQNRPKEEVFKDTDIRRPWVFIQLDGTEYKPELLKQIVRIINRHQANSMLLLAFHTHEQVEFVKKLGTYTGRSMRVYPANVTAEIIDAEDLSMFTAFSVPLSAGEEVIRKLQQTGKLVFGRRVENDAGLLKALELGLNGVTTTHPLRLQNRLDTWNVGCFDRGFIDADKPVPK